MGSQDNEAVTEVLDVHQQDALATLGYVYLQHQQADKALRLFTGLVEVCPDNNQFRASLACAHLQLRQYQQALALVNERVGQPGATPAFGLIAARALLGLNRDDDARAQLAQLSRRKPNEVHAK